jgi:hypothetical protein
VAGVAVYGPKIHKKHKENKGKKVEGEGEIRKGERGRGLSCSCFLEIVLVNMCSFF